MQNPRRVQQVIQSVDTSDGAGVQLKRSLGGPYLPELDPFLLLDEFRSDQPDDYIAGFPDHPHRGFETVTYMLAGTMQHKDNTGRSGRLRAGSVQWMTAGRGIIHSEMPLQENGLMWGFQLWVNLPSHDKMKTPLYQEFTPESIPTVKFENGACIKVIAGKTHGCEGAVKGIAVEPLYLDLSLPASQTLIQPMPLGHNAMVYVYEGDLRLPNSSASMKEIRQGQLAVLSDGDHVQLEASSASRLLLLAGRPIQETVVRYGPFVMNTQKEIMQAVYDYQSGNFT